MSEKSIKFGDEKVNKSNFYKNKKAFKAEDIDISKILVSKKALYGKESIRYLIGYNDDDVIRPFCIRLRQMIGYVKHFKNNNSKDTITMFFNVINNKLLKKYNKLLEKISNLLNKLKIEQKINTNFKGEKMPKENESYKCLSLIMLESVIKTGKKHYPRTFLEECKYEIKKKTVENLINDDFDPSSSDESDNEEYNEPDNEEFNGSVNEVSND